MLKLLRVLYLTPVLMLGSCTPDLASIQEATVRACNFLPTAVVVRSFFTQSPVWITAELVAQNICEHVTKPQLRRYRGTVRQPLTTVITLPNGDTVTVTGYFVR